MFRERTQASLTQEWFEDIYARRAELTSELKDAPAERRVAIMEQLSTIDRVLSDTKPTDLDAPFVTGDPLIDKWEKEIADGKVPDLSEDLADG